MAVTPPAAPSHWPSRTRGLGRRCAAFTWSSAAGATPAGVVSRSSTASPAAARPRAPVTAMTSPDFAVDRSTEAGAASPRSVTFTIQPRGEAEVSPPTTATSWARASSSNPVKNASASSTVTPSGQASATSAQRGRPPIDAMSERFTASDFQPTSAAVA